MKKGLILIFIFMSLQLPAQESADISRLKMLGFSFPVEPLSPPPLLAYIGKRPVQLTRQHKVTILYFWSTMVPSSLTDLPLLESLKQSMRGENILFAPVNLNEDHGQVMLLAENLNLTMDMFCYPEGEALSPYILHSVPSAYILNSHGMLVASIQGNASWGDPVMSRTLEELAGEEH